MSPSFYDVLTRPKKAPLYDRKAGNRIQYLKNGEKYECTILGTKIAVVNRHYTFVICLNEIVDVLVRDPFGVLTLLNRMDFITNAKTILEVRTKTRVLTETEALNKLKNTVKTEYYNRQVAELLFKIQLLANRLYHRSQTRISRTLSCGTKLTITSNMQTMRIENEAGLTLLFERPRRTTYPLGELGNKRSFYLTVATPIYALSFDLKGWIEDLIQSYQPTILFAEDGKLQRIAPDGKTQIRTIADSFIRNQNPFVLAAMNLN
jgi:hypothetical protein